MALFKFNYENRKTAFFFNALFTAVTFTIILIFNDQVDKYLEKQKYFHEYTHPYLKGLVHGICILFITLIITYLFYYVFGWGNTLFGTNA